MKLIENPYLSITTVKTTTTIEAAKKAQILPVIVLSRSKKEDMDFKIFMKSILYYMEIEHHQYIKFRSWCLLYLRKAVPHAG